MLGRRDAFVPAPEPRPTKVPLMRRVRLSPPILNLVSGADSGI